MARTNTEVVDLLPTFKVKRSQDFRAWALVTCPREDCDETFLVKLSSWYKPRKTHQGTLITGRPCPYCFRASHLPSRRAVR